MSRRYFTNGKSAVCTFSLTQLMQHLFAFLLWNVSIGLLPLLTACNVEHAIRFVKRFRLLSERYHNRRKRFALCFSLIAGICNFDRFA